MSEKDYKRLSKEAGKRIIERLPSNIDKIRQQRLLMDKVPRLYLVKK